MSETSTASKPLLPQQITPTTPLQLKESLMLQLEQQRMLHEKLEQQRELSLKNSSSISINNLSGLPYSQRNIPVPMFDKMRHDNVNKFQSLMRQQQEMKYSGGINSTQQQQQMQTGSLNLNSPFWATETLNTQERVTPAQLRQILSLQDAVAATQGENALMQKYTSPQPWFKQMPVIHYRDSSSDHLQRQHQQQLPRMVSPGDRKSVCLIGSQADDATSGGTSSHDQFISKRMIHDVLDLKGNLDPEVEDLVFEIAGNLIDSVTTLACTLAKHPKSSASDSKDVSLHPGGSKQENSKIADPEMCRRCNVTIPRILTRMNAQDATTNDLKIQYRELRMALVICILLTLFMLLDRFVEW